MRQAGIVMTPALMGSTHRLSAMNGRSKQTRSIRSPRAAVRRSMMPGQLRMAAIVKLHGPGFPGGGGITANPGYFDPGGASGIPATSAARGGREMSKFPHPRAGWKMIYLTEKYR